MAWIPHSHQMLPVLQVFLPRPPASGLWKCSLQLIRNIILAFLFIQSENLKPNHNKTQHPAFTDCMRCLETWKSVWSHLIAKHWKIKQSPLWTGREFYRLFSWGMDGKDPTAPSTSSRRVKRRWAIQRPLPWNDWRIQTSNLKQVFCFLPAWSCPTPQEVQRLPLNDWLFIVLDTASLEDTYLSPKSINSKPNSLLCMVDCNSSLAWLCLWTIIIAVLQQMNI